MPLERRKGSRHIEYKDSDAWGNLLIFVAAFAIFLVALGVFT